MKKAIKRVLGMMFLCIFTAITLTSEYSAINSETATMETALDLYPWRTYGTEDDILSELAHFTKIDMADYCGVYFDDSGSAVVVLKEGSDSYLSSVTAINAAKASMNKSKNIIIKSAKYSKEELDRTRNKIREFFPFIDNFTMIEMGITYSKNHIYIGIDNNGDIKTFTEILLQKLGMTISESDMFHIYPYDHANDVNYLAKIDGCSELKYGTSSFSAW